MVWHRNFCISDICGKSNKDDVEYKESFGDPRVPKEKKEEAKRQIVIPKVKKK